MPSLTFRQSLWAFGLLNSHSSPAFHSFGFQRHLHNRGAFSRLATRARGRNHVPSRGISHSTPYRQAQSAQPQAPKPVAVPAGSSPSTQPPTTSRAAATTTPKPSKPTTEDLFKTGLSDRPLEPEDKGENQDKVDWTRSYHGISAEPFPKDAADVLLAPVDSNDVEIKPDGIVYLPEIKYRRILNKAFGPGGWGLVPRSESIVTPKTVTREYALICNGRYAPNVAN
jgi:Mitochondrial genome maintenance MGM101